MPGAGRSAPPDALVDALARATRDLERAAGATVATSLSPAPDDDAAWRVDVEFEDGSVAGFEVLSDHPDMPALVAEAIQPAFIEHTGKTVPECPDHPHPAEPVQAGAHAYWTCPATQERLWLIGDYPGPRG